MIYAIVNTKGGVGKTTIAVHLAAMLAADDPQTLLIDGDEQASAAAWAAWRRDLHPGLPSPTTSGLRGRAILAEGRSLSARFSNVVVDAGGRDSSGLRAAMVLADMAIVPVGASQLDAAAITDVLAIVDMARDHNPALKVRVLLNRIDVRTRDTAEMLAFLIAQDLDVMRAVIAERVAYRRAVGEGITAAEYARDRAATSEIDAFVAEVKA